MNIEEQLRHWIGTEILEGADAGLTASSPLMELGVIDSISVVKLQRFVASQFGVQIPHRALTPARLSSIQSIARLVTELQNPST